MRTPLAVSILFFSLLPVSTQAITNIESQRQSDDINGLNGSIDISISGKSGNSEKQTTAISGRLDYREGKHQGLFIASTEYGKSNDVKDEDNNFVHVRYIQHQSPTFAWEGFVQYQDDLFKLLNSRALVGAGGRFNLTPNQSQHQFTLGLGAYYTEEVYQLNSFTELTEDYTRGNLYLSFAKQLTPSTIFSNTLYWQPRLSQPSDSYVYNSLSLSVKINQSLALKLTIESQYDSEPVTSVKDVDHSYNTSLEYQF